MASRDYPLFIIDTSRTHGRGREKDFVACTSRELPFVGEVTLLNEPELEIDQDWANKPANVLFSDDNGAGIRAKLKVLSTPSVIDKSNTGDLRSLMRRCLKEWSIRRGTTTVDTENVSNEAVVKFAETLLEQTRENLREDPDDSQAYMVGCILERIRRQFSGGTDCRIPDRETLGQFIRKLRVELGISIRGMAERCDLSPMTVQNIEGGKFSPRLEIILLMLRELGAELIARR